MGQSIKFPSRIEDRSLLVRHELARLLASPQFREAERLKRFLCFVVETKINGNADDLKESLIGILVFDRRTGFDPKQDPIVRVTARRLREKLEQFYESAEGKSEIIIRLPKGSYVPEWEIDTLQTVPDNESVAGGRDGRSIQIRWTAIGSAVAVLLVASAFLILRRDTRLSVPEPVSRFTIELGPNETLRQYYGNNLAFSPDGRSLAYVSYQNETPRLMIRSLSETQSRLLPGSEDAKAPLYSADGQSIVAYVPSHLRRFFIAGGMQDIAQVSSSLALFGSAWDGQRLLFNDAPPAVLNTGGFSSIFSVLPSSQRSPEPLLVQSTARTEESQMIQQTLPDAEGYLLTIHGATERTEIVSRENSRRQVLVENARGALYLTPGYVVFWSDGDIKAAPMSLPLHRLTGPQVTVIHNVGFSGWEGAEMAISPQGTLAYVERASPIPDRRMAWVDHTGKTTPLPIPPAPIAPLRVSSDGSNLLLARFDRGEKRWTLWNYSLQQGTSRQLTQPSQNLPYATWSPDNRSVVYLKRIDKGPSNLFVRSADGAADSPEWQMTHFQEAGIVPYAWSHDGKWVCGTRGMLAATKSDIYAVTTDGKEADRAVAAEPDYEFNPDLSPDGRWVAYQKDLQIYIRAFPGVATDAAIPVGSGAGPMWDPSGHMLYFRRGPTMMQASVRFDPEPRLGNPVSLFTTDAMQPDLWIRNAQLSADGKRFLLSFAEQDPSEGHRINVVVNWFAELRGFFHPQS